MPSVFQLRPAAGLVAGCGCIILAVWRAVDVFAGLANGSEHALLAYPLTVIFPAVLIAILLMFPPSQSREGLLMRVGTIIQLLLILALPRFALYLALGMPVVFLVVELFETRLPAPLRDRLARLVVA
ncbi:MAG: hypothetical protein ABL901_02495 [Hyphomicrobiaceae bacterium]